MPGVSAASSRSTSSVHPAAPKRSGTQATSAERIFGISTRFGHNGVTATTRSPGAISASAASISADIPDAVTAISPGAVGPMQRRYVAGERIAQLGNAEILRIERFAARERRRRGLADERRRNFVRLAEPEREHVRIVHARIRDVADLRSADRTHGLARDGGRLRSDVGDVPRRRLHAAVISNRDFEPVPPVTLGGV